MNEESPNKGKHFPEHLWRKRRELILALYKEGYSQQELGKIFNISRSNVSFIINWKAI